MIVQAEIPYEDVRLYNNVKDSEKSWNDKLRGHLRIRVAPGRIIDNFFTFVIITNIVVLALYHSDSSLDFNKAFKILNLSFTVLYTVEGLIKIYAYGLVTVLKIIRIPRYFVISNWNKFDFILVIAGFIEIILDNNATITDLKKSKAAFKSLPQVVRILRVLRVSRIFRLVEKY
jgi:hypothetical protein